MLFFQAACNCFSYCPACFDVWCSSSSLPRRERTNSSFRLETAYGIMTIHIINCLNRNMLKATGNSQPWTSCSTTHFLSYGTSAPCATQCLFLCAHDIAKRSNDFKLVNPILRVHYPAVLPALRRICSAQCFTPLPLYGSGGRSLRIRAATWPTSS